MVTYSGGGGGGYQLFAEPKRDKKIGLCLQKSVITILI